MAAPLETSEVAPLPYFVKELRRKILRGIAGKIFRALDNDFKLKFKNCGRHFLPSALIASLPAEHRSADFFPVAISTGCRLCFLRKE